jgi:hypothetical protein
MSQTTSILFSCCYEECKGDKPNRIVLSIAEIPKDADVGKEKAVYCRRGHLNLITLSASLDYHPLILGEDDPVADNVLAGKKP